MGRKKRNRLYVAPFCFYCEKECPDEKVLIQHQRARHYRCLECGKRFDHAPALIVHMIQVHKINLPKVPHALDGRENPDLDIRGMIGVPREIIDKRREDKAHKMGIKVHKSDHTVQAGRFGEAPPIMLGGLNHPPTGAPPGFMGHPQGSLPPGLGPLGYDMMINRPPMMGFQGPTGTMMPMVPPEVIRIPFGNAEENQYAQETIKLAPTPPSGDLIYGVENISPDERRLMDHARSTGIRAS